MTLRDLKVGQSARIKAVGGEGELRQHFLDMGVIPGAELTLVKLLRWAILWSFRSMDMNLHSDWLMQSR